MGERIMGIIVTAEVMDSKPHPYDTDRLVIQFEVCGDSCRRLRRAFDILKGPTLSEDLSRLLSIASDAVELIDNHKEKLH